MSPGMLCVDEPYDLICVGFGPASLAVAVALRDKKVRAKVLFLERQNDFAWHSGMLLPGARMQVSFLKDLATFRDPTSPFTFLNYLKQRGRLEAFTNLGTFLPLREEFNDYLGWAAAQFRDCVRYGTEVQSISAAPSTMMLDATWEVTWQDVQTSALNKLATKHVIIAIGGSPRLPRSIRSFGPRVAHSSRYLGVVARLSAMQSQHARLAVVGGGQSAAEIFDDLTSRFPSAQTTLYTSGSALRPSDDSPFVNEVFDPNHVSKFYSLPSESRTRSILENRATNYSVVRGELLQRLYENQYRQRLYSRDESSWKHRIVFNRELEDVREHMSGDFVDLVFRDSLSNQKIIESAISFVLVATGYDRNAHEKMLEPLADHLEAGPSAVERDYRLKIRPGLLGPQSGSIWLQGCCEESHGISDTLLSILATRSGELVDSIFGGDHVQIEGVSHDV